MVTIKFYPIDKPIIVNAITCRLKYYLGPAFIPADELKLIVSILEAATAWREQFKPSDFDREVKGFGTLEKIEEAQRKLVEAIEADL